MRQDGATDTNTGGTGAGYIDLGPGRAEDINSGGNIVLVSDGAESRIWFNTEGFCASDYTDKSVY